MWECFHGRSQQFTHLKWDVTGRTVGGIHQYPQYFLAGFISVSSEHVALSKSCQFKHLSMFTSTCCHFINLGVTSLQPFLNILNQHPFLTHSFLVARPALPPLIRQQAEQCRCHLILIHRWEWKSHFPDQPLDLDTILPQLVTIGNYETL